MGRPKTHGEAGTRLYRIWGNMKTRCEYPGAINYSYYGGKGVTVCAEWSQSYETFRDWALVNGYDEDLTIDRINGDKGYSPDNCRWSTMTSQARNKSCTWKVTIDGVTKPAIEWCEESGVPYQTAYRRKNEMGWADIESVIRPSRRYRKKAV